MSRPLQFTLKQLFLTVSAIACVLAALQMLMLYETGRIQYPDWSKISVGDSRQRVLELMGEPDFISDEFYLWHEYSHVQLYAEAEATNAKIWFRYRTGISHILTIGFDAQDQVVYKAEGDT